ncbi:MAG: transcriptional regulator NrdR [Vulcanimicrobiota bacterium]
MRCPYCSDLDNRVLDSRLTDEERSIRRRRECANCGKRFTTYERFEETILMVVKKDGRREKFDRQKVVHGLLRACEKRPLTADQIEGLTSSLEASLRQKNRSEIPVAEIGERILEGLRELDEVAYVRYASVYKDFNDVSRFIEELQTLPGYRKED